MSVDTIFLFIAGLVLLVGGAELLVRGAARLATAVGVSPLVTGLTVVAFGTSSPELAVSLRAALAGQADIALGNVVGSNICNVLLILGVSAAITPLAVAGQLLRFDVWVMIGVTLVALLLGLDGRIGRLDGAALILGALLYTVWLIRQSRRERSEAVAEFAREYGPDGAPARPNVLINLALVIVGLALLVLGARWLVDAAVNAARLLGVSELIIGLTVVAVGTSMPEIATSVIAAVRGERDIAVGNVVGSNIFNLLSVLGLAAAVSPAGVAVPRSAMLFDMPVMLGVAVACLPVFFTGRRIDRWEGMLFLGYYVAYTVFLILDATRSHLLPWYRAAMLGFVIPLTVVTLLVLTLRHRRSAAPA